MASYILNTVKEPTINSIGKNPHDVAGYDLVTKLYDYDKVINQGINRFIKHGNTSIDALHKFYNEETGGFTHVLEGEINLMETEQALISLN